MFVARDDFSNIENFGIREQQIKPCIWKMKFAILTNKKKNRMKTTSTPNIVLVVVSKHRCLLKILDPSCNNCHILYQHKIPKKLERLFKDF